MENYERLTIDLLGSDMTPKAKYERVKFLLATHKLYNDTKQSLIDDMEYFGNEHQRRKQAERTYGVLTGITVYNHDNKDTE